MRPFRYASVGLALLRMRYLARWLREETHVLARSDRRMVRGLQVSVAHLWMPEAELPRGASLDAAFVGIDACLAMVEAHAPFVLAGLRRTGTRLLVDQYPRPVFWTLSRTFHVPLEMAVHSSPIYGASSIVHEWTHARVSAAQAYANFGDERSLPKEEALCATQQADFVARVPDEVFPQKDALVDRIWRSYESGYWRRDRLRKEREDWLERVTSRMLANPLSAAQSQTAP